MSIKSDTVKRLESLMIKRKQDIEAAVKPFQTRERKRVANQALAVGAVGGTVGAIVGKKLANRKISKDPFMTSSEARKITRKSALTGALIGAGTGVGGVIAYKITPLGKRRIINRLWDTDEGKSVTRIDNAYIKSRDALLNTDQLTKWEKKYGKKL